jgi:hypothetical protein
MSRLYLIPVFLFLVFAVSCSHVRIPHKELIPTSELKSKCPEQPANIVVTNRNRTTAEDSFKYFGNQVRTEEPLKYLSVCCLNDTWSFEEHETFKSLFNYLNPEKNILIFVHGDGKLFSEIVERNFMLRNIYDVNVIAFDYPSEDPTIHPRYKNYFNSMRNIDKSMPQFKAFLEEFQDELKEHESFSENKVSILFHSLGGYLFKRAMDDKSFENINNDLFDNIILNAPAVSQKYHASWLDRAPLKGNVYVTQNNDDFILRGAKMLSRQHMLGLDAEKPFSNKAEYIDFSEVYSYEHNYFLMEPPQGDRGAREVFYQMFNGLELDFSSSRFKQMKENRTFSVQPFSEDEKEP